MTETAIRTEGLSKRFGAVDALSGLYLQVERGEVLGYLGPNGAGKTTTIRLLLDLARPSAGLPHQGRRRSGRRVRRPAGSPRPRPPNE